MKNSGILVIIGGVILKIVAHSLAELRGQLKLLDQGRSTPNASQDNFRLLWMQTKGLGMNRYAVWGCVSDEGAC